MLSGSDMNTGADAKGGNDHAPQRSRQGGRSPIKRRRDNAKESPRHSYLGQGHRNGANGVVT